MRMFTYTLAMLSLLTMAALASTIESAHRHAYSANAGWMDARADEMNGVVVGTNVCSGYVYSANLGWIHLGDGIPNDGLHYRNDDVQDYGVNIDAMGNLRGYAYGANIGWIQFESLGAPAVDLATGWIRGYAYSANIGWISLSNALAQLKTAPRPVNTDTDGDGIPDAWERQYAPDLATLTQNGDADGDGQSDRKEYEADTNPFDAASSLRITSYDTGGPGTTATLTWTSRPTRRYRIDRRIALTQGTPWIDAGLGDITPGTGDSTTRSFPESGAGQGFYRVQAFLPPSP